MMTDRPLLTEVCATTTPGDHEPEGSAVAMPRVHKFGGTSMDGAERLQALAAIIRDQRDPSVVVVSAMAGVSDELSRLADAATTGDDAPGVPDPATTLAAMKQRHLDALQVIVKEDAARASVAARIDEIFDGATQLLGEGPGAEAKRFTDQLMAVGEDLAVELAVSALQAEGIAAAVLNAREVVWTNSEFGAAVPDFESIRKLAPSNILSVVEEGCVPVVQGFIGSEADGATTTLGRGGSDFTATLLGAALGSPEVVIWTDVDGILSGDPSLVGDARVVPDVGSEEAVELSYFGARVIHPAAAKHAIASDLPLRIKNSFAPERPGTLIHSHRGGAAAFAAVAHKTNVALIRVRAFPTALAYGFLARVFGVLGRHAVPVDLVSTSHSSTAFTVDRDEDLSAVYQALSVFSEVDVLKDVATVTVVGRGMLREPGMDALVFWAVEKTPVYLISQASDVSINFVVDEAEAPELVHRLHLSLIELKEGAREDAAREEEEREEEVREEEAVEEEAPEDEALEEEAREKEASERKEGDRR
jgi:aspartate kinase